MSFLFEKLHVYQRAIDFSKEVELLCKRLPKGSNHIKSQLRRASISIALNIAEGNGRWHKKERRKFFFIARGSAFECIALFEIANRTNILQENIYNKAREDLEIISKMITSLIKGLEKKIEQLESGK